MAKTRGMYKNRTIAGHLMGKLIDRFCRGLYNSLGGNKMNHDSTTLMTKKALAASLKKLMETKALNKISIREIVEDCGVNRKTFYYHFNDIYDLVKWFFEKEAIEVVKQYDLMANHEEAIHFAMDYIEKNKHVCNSALDTLGRDQLKSFFYKNFIGIMNNIVEDFSEKMVIPDDYKTFIINYYTETIASMLVKWIRNKDSIDKEIIIKYISLTLFDSIEPTLERANKEFSPLE